MPQPRRVLDRTLIVLFVLTLLIMTGDVVWSSLSTNRLLANETRMAQTEGALASLDAVVLDVADAETSQIGYLFTGAAQSLDSFHAAARQARADTAALKRLTALDAATTPLVSLLEEHVNEKLKQLDQAISIQQALGRDAAQTFATSTHSKAEMAEIHSLADVLRTSEGNQLQARHDALQLNSRVVRAASLAAGITAAIMVVVFYDRTRRIVVERTTLLAQEQAARGIAERALAGEQAARREAESANRLKDEFLATVSHELRTPLNAMLGWALMLRKRTLDPERTERGLEAIERNAKAQAQLIEDLLDISRITSGKMRLRVGAVDPVVLVGAAMDVVRPAADAKGVQLSAQIAPELADIAGDLERLQQVIWNLMSNAVKFTPRGGRVDVRVAQTDGHVEIAVSDTGAGIAPAFLPHVFELFRQADSSAARAHGGLGLGLAIARNIVEMHGGTIHAESAGPGRGATFRVELPRQAATAGVPAIRSGAPGAVADGAVLVGRRVLAVDDEADARDVICDVLGERGADVRAVDNARAAVRALADWRPDVLLADIGLPAMDGYALIEQVRALPRDRGGRTPAAALTAYARVEDRMRALSAGFQVHLAKPIDPVELVAIVADLIREQSQVEGA